MRKGVNHHTMRKKLKIRSVQFIFSVFMFVMTAGMTGCQNEESEFLEKELEQEESGETADVEQKELKDTESGKASLAGTDLASETSPDSTESEGISKKKAEITESDQSSAIQQPVSRTIYVDVCGAVVNPGVYELSSDSRVFQAIEKAGGYLPGAAASYLNRARSLYDGQQIYVPTQEEVDSQTIPLTQDETAQDGVVQEGTAQTGTAADNTADGAGTTQAGQRIDLNTADVSQLSTLTGVGESKALAIIAYREENGPFTSIEDIMNVPGIKEGTYEKIKDKIAIE